MIFGNGYAHVDQEDAKPFEYPEGSGIYYKVTTAIKETIDFCELSGSVDSDPIPVNDGCWDNLDGTVSTLMTVAELNSLYIYGYGIPADNYSNMKVHIAALHQLAADENALPEEIKNYDYSTGWRLERSLHLVARALVWRLLQIARSKDILAVAKLVAGILCLGLKLQSQKQ